HPFRKPGRFHEVSLPEGYPYRPTGWPSIVHGRGLLATIGGPSISTLLDVVEPFAHDPDRLFGPANIAHLTAHLLAFGQADSDDIPNGLGFLRTVLLPIEQHPGIGDDRVRCIAIGVGEPGPQVLGQLDA